MKDWKKHIGLGILVSVVVILIGLAIFSAIPKNKHIFYDDYCKCGNYVYLDDYCRGCGLENKETKGLISRWISCENCKWLVMIKNAGKYCSECGKTMKKEPEKIEDKVARLEKEIKDITDGQEIIACYKCKCLIRKCVAKISKRWSDEYYCLECYEEPDVSFRTIVISSVIW